EPEVTVRARRDAGQKTGDGDAGAELGDDAGRRDPADTIATRNDTLLGEPEVAVRARRNGLWYVIVLGNSGAELGDDAGRRDPTDAVAVAGVFREPEVPVRAHRDVGG